MLTFTLDETKYTPGQKPESVIYHSADPSRVMAWRDQLSEVEIAIIEKWTAKYAKYWAFPASNPRIRPSEVAARIAIEKTGYRFLRSGRLAKKWLRDLRWRLKYR
jgi:hypothetical protein